MTTITDAKIRDLAYQLWARDGSPDGKDEDYWYAAEKVLADDIGEDATDDSDGGLPPLTPLAVPNK